MGILAYAFFANSEPTLNRPPDEHRFQIKYGSKDGAFHEVWQDAFGLYTTLFFGINIRDGFFVGADPVLHNPTRLFISLEFKQSNVDSILSTGWTSWERVKRDRLRNEYPTEVLVGGTKKSFLQFIRFERTALGLDPGHRQMLAEKLGLEARSAVEVTELGRAVPHALAAELELSHEELLDLIATAPRLKMAVRGWVAEVHLQRQLAAIPGVHDCVRLEKEGAADIRLRYCGSRPFDIECKNVLRQRLVDGTIRLDFQRTRSSKADPCSRFYAASDFAIVAACLHSCTEQWEFRYMLTGDLPQHPRCSGKLNHAVRLDDLWTADVDKVLSEAAARA
ncbi:MAG: hypothetical protein HYV63_16215 [Candidatus Schekmanbacteria bacterium]|nr:hypothetical protein [Candidatus Schekmanbacteria bacterium]